VMSRSGIGRLQLQLAYLPGNATRIRVKAVGELQLEAADA